MEHGPKDIKSCFEKRIVSQTICYNPSCSRQAARTTGTCEIGILIIKKLKGNRCYFYSKHHWWWTKYIRCWIYTHRIFRVIIGLCQLHVPIKFWVVDAEFFYINDITVGKKTSNWTEIRWYIRCEVKNNMHCTRHKTMLFYESLLNAAVQYVPN